MKNGTFTAF